MSQAKEWNIDSTLFYNIKVISFAQALLFCNNEGKV